MLDNPDEYEIYPTTKFYNDLINQLEAYIGKEIEHSLDLQRVQHSRTMDILIKNHKKEKREAYKAGQKSSPR
ncbi:MAG: hypothetical protein NUV69_00650, partial [Candidatus Curtissbacteria bacterium]|nr:hypothetical protein [Candidatus Curtissbacteria bacterium]